MEKDQEKRDPRELLTREGALIFAEQVKGKVREMFDAVGFISPAAFVLMTVDPQTHEMLKKPIIGRIDGDTSTPELSAHFEKAVRHSAKIHKAVGVLMVFQAEEVEPAQGTTGNESIDQLFDLEKDEHQRIKDVVLLAFEHLRFGRPLAWAADVLHENSKTYLGDFHEVEDVNEHSPFAGLLTHFN